MADDELSAITDRVSRTLPDNLGNAGEALIDGWLVRCGIACHGDPVWHAEPVGDGNDCPPQMNRPRMSCDAPGPLAAAMLAIGSGAPSTAPRRADADA